MKLRYFIDQNLSKGEPHENEFWVFSNSEINVTVRAEKVDEKNGVICLVSMFSSWVMVLKLSKKWYFLELCADLSRKPNSVKTFYMYASESSHYFLSENGMVDKSLSHRSWDFSD